MEHLSTPHKKPSILSFWMIIATINVILGTAIGVIRMSVNEGHAITQPAFVVLSNQAEREHLRLDKKIDQTNHRVDVVEQKVEKLEDRIHSSHTKEPK